MITRFNIKEKDTAYLIHMKNKLKSCEWQERASDYIMTINNYLGISLIIIGFIGFFERQIFTTSLQKIMLFYLVISIINMIWNKMAIHNLKVHDEIDIELKQRK